jgi:hypothetical protein
VAVSGGPLLFEMVVSDGGFIIPGGQHYEERKRRAAKRWGEGTVLQARVEPKDEGISDGQRRYYFGRVVGPYVDYTGDLDFHDNVKAALIQDGRTSITQLNHDEMAFFIAAAEYFAHTKCPDAFALDDRRI